MDQVLSDFDRAACRLYGTHPEHLPYGRGWELTHHFGTDRQEFTERVDAAGTKFWEDIEPLPWLHNVWNVCNAYTNSVVVLTSPGGFIHSHIGKTRWLKQMFGTRFEDFIIHRNKYMLAKKDTLLIDDSTTNCISFVKAGGTAMVFPAAGNYRRDVDPANFESLLIEALKR